MKNSFDMIVLIESKKGMVIEGFVVFVKKKQDEKQWRLFFSLGIMNQNITALPVNYFSDQN